MCVLIEHQLFSVSIKETMATVNIGVNPLGDTVESTVTLVKREDRDVIQENVDTEIKRGNSLRTSVNSRHEPSKNRLGCHACGD
jgi:hypothetical protein